MNPVNVIKPFSDLTLAELHACLKLRGEVFVVGQQIYMEADVDEQDPLCHHVMVWLDDELVGTARLLPIDHGKVIKVGRVAVAQSQRGRGVGGAMMRALQLWIHQVPGRSGTMSAQAHLENWYSQLGWVRDSGPFMEAGIEHLGMLFPSENPD